MQLVGAGNDLDHTMRNWEVENIKSTFSQEPPKLIEGLVELTACESQNLRNR